VTNNTADRLFDLLFGDPVRKYVVLGVSVVLAQVAAMPLLFTFGEHVYLIGAAFAGIALLIPTAAAYNSLLAKTRSVSQVSLNKDSAQAPFEEYDAVERHWWAWPRKPATSHQLLEFQRIVISYSLADSMVAEGLARHLVRLTGEEPKPSQAPREARGEMKADVRAAVVLVSGAYLEGYPGLPPELEIVSPVRRLFPVPVDEAGRDSLRGFTHHLLTTRQPLSHLGPKEMESFFAKLAYEVIRAAT
jgi:hypothetical protein